MRLSPVFMHDELNDAQQNELICFFPKSSRRFVRLKNKNGRYSTLYDDFSPESFSIFKAVCPQKIAKSYQKSFLGYLYLFLLTMSQFEYEYNIRKKEIIQNIKIETFFWILNEFKHLQ